MSREVRRVPLGWQHPVEHNPHWYFQANTPHGRSKPPSRLHGPTEHFVGLHGTPVSEAQADWDRERSEWEAGEHQHLVWLLGYHAAEGWVDHEGNRKVTPYKVYAEDGETVEREFHPESVADLLAVYPYEDYAGSRPTEADHMPDCPEGVELGWCLYETVSEGTPCTPVFATAEELIDHLATVGQDWDQVPLRRSAAEALVSSGWMPSMIVAGGQMMRGAEDADRIAALPKATT